MEKAKRLSDKVQDANEQIEDINDRLKRAKEDLNRPLDEYDARGWVEDVGPRLFRPGTHRLRLGAEPVCYLKSSKYNLYDYVGSLVGIKGEVIVRGGRKVLIVDRLDVLHAEKSDF